MQQPISDEYLTTVGALTRPNPPTPEAVKRAQFVDKTYIWKQANTINVPK